MEPSESLPPDAALPNQDGEKPAGNRPAEPALAPQAPTTAAELVPVLLPLENEIIARSAGSQDRCGTARRSGGRTHGGLTADSRGLYLE